MDGWKNVSVQKIESPVKENTKEIRKQGKKKLQVGICAKKLQIYKSDFTVVLMGVPTKNS